jgi:hypothetical protein
MAASRGRSNSSGPPTVLLSSRMAASRGRSIPSGPPTVLLSSRMAASRGRSIPSGPPTVLLSSRMAASRGRSIPSGPPTVLLSSRMAASRGRSIPSGPPVAKMPSQDPGYVGDAPLPWPVGRGMDQPPSCRVARGVFQLAEVVRLIPHLSVPATIKPGRTEVDKGTSREPLPVAAPGAYVLRNTAGRSTEEMHMLRHDHVVPDAPMGSTGPRREQRVTG